MFNNYEPELPPDNISHYIEPESERERAAGDEGKLFIDVATIRQTSRRSQNFADLPITFRNQ